MTTIQTQKRFQVNHSARGEKRCYTASDIMSILNIGRKSVYGLIHRKEFPAIHISSAGYRIPKDTFYEWLYKTDR